MITCSVDYRYKAMKDCIECRYGGCSKQKEYVAELIEQGAATLKNLLHFRERRIRMYIFKHIDGSLTEAPAEFNPESPDFSKLTDISEVLMVEKALVKEFRLVARQDGDKQVRRRRGRGRSKVTVSDD